MKAHCREAARDIIGILRGVRPNEVLKIVDAALVHGIRRLEVTLDSPSAFGVHKLSRTRVRRTG